MFVTVVSAFDVVNYYNRNGLNLMDIDLLRL